MQKNPGPKHALTTREAADTYHSNMHMTPSLYPPSSPTMGGGSSRPQSSFPNPPPYRGSAFSNTPPQGYEGAHYGQVVPSEADPDAARASAVSELGGQEIIASATGPRQELAAGQQEIRVFRVAGPTPVTPPPAPPPAGVAPQDRFDDGEAAVSPPARWSRQNELYIWDGPAAGRGGEGWYSRER